MHTAVIMTSDPNKDKAAELHALVLRIAENLDPTTVILGTFSGTGEWEDEDEFSHAVTFQFPEHSEPRLYALLRFAAQGYDQDAIGVVVQPNTATLLYPDSDSPENYRS